VKTILNASLKAVILAAGKGTRMKHLTNDLPKPMLQVAGKPVLEHIVGNLAAAGVGEFCIITGYRAETIESHFGDGSRWGVNIGYARQAVQDGTGRAPELAKDFVGESSFFMVYGDILVKPSNYLKMALAFNQAKPAGLITVTEGEDISKGAAVTFDSDFCLREIIEKPTPGTVSSPWYNAGLYIFDPKLFAYTSRLQKSPRGEYELPDAMRAMVADGCRIKGLVLEGYWIDVRDPEMLAKAQGLVTG
jgi:NDP-sugar pyrophosphorylase family protein